MNTGHAKSGKNNYVRVSPLKAFGKLTGHAARAAPPTDTSGGSSTGLYSWLKGR